MPPFFRPQHDLYLRLFLLAAVGGVVLACVVGEVWKWASYETGVGVAVVQPVAFSHKHHVGQDGLDCRYCHTSVETSASAGMPSMRTCMTCHSQIWNDSPMLKPVRESVKTGVPVVWNRVYRVPQYVYFNHGIHVQKGIGCASCHGEIDQMPFTVKARTFYMRDCLSCHRDPEPNMRPRSEIFNLHWNPTPEEQAEHTWMSQYVIHRERMTDCMTCHR